MKRLLKGLLWGCIGYVVAAVVGYGLVGALSSNTHDVSIEAAMTSAFVFGPLGGLLAFIAGVIKGGARPSGATRG